MVANFQQPYFITFFFRLQFATFIYFSSPYSHFLFTMPIFTIFFIRFFGFYYRACHFASGILIWDIYAPEGTPVWLYSFLYNGGYMAGELIITVILMLMITPAVMRLAKK
ncbi:MAG: energy-coupled thiamine transporter ThiT [Clostridia bacterium]|nr:energy-coupled thiamine transporter ThiT [Clostridia bacterium]